MVIMSHTAMPSNTVLVAVLILGLVRTMMMMVLRMLVTHIRVGMMKP